MQRLTASPPEHFFCVSTDKASSPVNVMGASKRLMEKVIMSFSEDFKVTTARFANVAFSNGSLLDGYIHRLFHAQPLACPSNIKRYFVTPQESGEICLIASVLARSGEIVFPNLQPVQMKYFKEITVQFLSALGKEVDVCQTEEEARRKAVALGPDSNQYPVYYFDSHTSGEKPFEEFYKKTDDVDQTRFEALGVITNKRKEQKENIKLNLDRIQKAVHQIHDKSDIVGLLTEILDDFDHKETGASLDEGM